MTDEKTILIERRDGVVTLTLNRPARKNAITADMWRTLLSVLEEIAGRPDDRVVVVTGAGSAFSSGADLSAAAMSAYREMRTLDVMRVVGDVALALHRLPKPTIARVNGVAVGAGCNLALACDLVVASEAATFQEIFVPLGLAVDFGGTWLLPRLVGLHRAKELALLGKKVPAHRAAAIGLVNRVVRSEELDEAVSEWACSLAATAPLAVALTKRMLNDSFRLSMEDALDGEARNQHIAFGNRASAGARASVMEPRTTRSQDQ